MTKLPKAQVSLPSDHEVKVTRQFDAPRELVFRAYTTPALMQRWLLGYPGWTMPVCEMDVRVGGKFRWRWRNDKDGSEFGFHGTFKEVDPPARIVHTEYYDPGDIGGSMGEGSLITVELTEKDGITTLVTLMDFGTKEARDAAMSTGMTDGMEMSYQVLDALLAEPDVANAS
ncbi:MAG: SRPBCC family protein [Gammaproteobacteria bacterium]|nr:SRPBCC family protein [Gammaproteobacteria bacterium]